ncbi:MAG: hypothetical protein OXG02_05270 [Chloroflexi bacterium]|nr:hypothetical protein [Chloroflexota bacterium]
MTNKQRADLTYKDNLRRGRHGWIRLTPAYSVKIVREILDQHPNTEFILEPFSGTGTTGLVAAQRGLSCDLYDINPFLVWLADVKCAVYSDSQIAHTRELGQEIIRLVRTYGDVGEALWTPPISNIERWWSKSKLVTLAKIFQSINSLVPCARQERDLLLIAFCRLVINWSNAAFNHQSISFRNNDNQQHLLFSEDEGIFQSFISILSEILSAASEYIPGTVSAYLHDARHIESKTSVQYDVVITSPPYPNRMSYIRELRPYMFWLGFLKRAGDAGELDWDAIGGTWGIATSRLNDWTPENGHGDIPSLYPLIEEIAQSSNVLSRYIHRYFADMSHHFSSLHDVVAPEGKLFYIIGNSKFYNTLVPAEQLYAELMEKHGFEDACIKTIRKRNSKKELYEYLVTARKPS